jgi:molecular chaperone GrpE
MSDAGADNDEQILDRFRIWLQEVRQSAHEVDSEPAPGAGAPGFSFERLVEEFTALRQDVKLQARSSRALEELVTPAVTALNEAVAAFRAAAAQTPDRNTEPTDKQLAVALAELDDALERGREQWNRAGARLVGPNPSPALARLHELRAGQSWLTRRLTGSYHRRLCAALEAADEQARRERQELLTALLGGTELLQQRLARTMAGAGVVRIPAVGRTVDPEIMVVVGVVEVEGPAGQVVEEIRRGYTWKGALLRPAEVRAIRPRGGG